jgi:hypothetical protein
MPFCIELLKRSSQQEFIRVGRMLYERDKNAFFLPTEMFEYIVSPLTNLYSKQPTNSQQNEQCLLPYL